MNQLRHSSKKSLHGAKYPDSGLSAASFTPSTSFASAAFVSLVQLYARCTIVQGLACTSPRYDDRVGSAWGNAAGLRIHTRIFITFQETELIHAFFLSAFGCGGKIYRRDWPHNAGIGSK